MDIGCFVFAIIAISIVTTTEVNQTSTVAPINPCEGFAGLRLENTKDSTCRTYILCILNGLTFEAWVLKCPRKLIFRPITRTCVTTAMYKCSPTTTTTTTTTTPVTPASTTSS